MLEETNASGVAQADYIYPNGRPIATLDPSTGALYFLNDDSLGTPQVATDSSQSIAWQATYQPFGQASVSGTITQNLRFPGQYFDAESGWNHNGFRDYIPDLGRYAEPDPLAMQGSAKFYNTSTGDLVSIEPLHLGDVNSFAYVRNAPIDLIDPLGLRGCKAAQQLTKDCLKEFYNSDFGKAVNFFSLGSLFPGWGPNPMESLKEWGIAIVGKGGGGTVTVAALNRYDTQTITTLTGETVIGSSVGGGWPGSGEVRPTTTFGCPRSRF